MSRILRHVGKRDFKKVHQRQVDEQRELAAKKLKEWQEAEEERRQIEEIARPYKSDWRRDLIEAMTTDSIATELLPAYGDVDLGTAYPNFTLSGTGIAGYNSTTKSMIGSRDRYDTIVVRVTSNSAEWEILDGGYNANFDALGSGGTGSYTVVIPRVYGSLYYTARDNGSISFSTVYQRRSPMNVGVRLDDPEANAFMKGHLGGDKERKKRFKEQLEASKEWMDYLGLEGSKTSPGDIELGQAHPPGGPNPYGTPGADDPYQDPPFPDDPFDDSDFEDPFPDLPLA